MGNGKYFILAKLAGKCRKGTTVFPFHFSHFPFKPYLHALIIKSVLGIWCLRQKRAIFRQFFEFLKAHRGATQPKKGKKMAEKSRFGPSDQIPNTL